MRVKRSDAIGELGARLADDRLFVARPLLQLLHPIPQLRLIPLLCLRPTFMRD